MSTEAIQPNERAAAEPRQTLNATDLVEWVKGDIMDAHSMGLFNKLLRCQRTRACWWPDKIGDGQKQELPYGTRASTPWAGALDHEVRVVDAQCNAEVDVALMAWFRSEKTVRPRDAMNDEQNLRATAWRHATEFYLDATKRQMLDAAELFANALSEFGQAVWFEGWKDHWRKGRKTMAWTDCLKQATDEQLQQVSGMQGGEEIQPEQAAMIQEGVVAMLEYMRQDKTQDPAFRMLLGAIDPNMQPVEQTRVIAAFRKGDATVDYFAPVPCTALPVHKAFIPGVDCFYPTMARPNEDVPRMAFVEWFTEARIRTESVQDGWDEKFTEAVLKRGPGLAFDLMAWGATGVTSWELNGIDMAMQYNTEALKNAGLYQLVWLWHWGVGEDGLPAPYRTLLDPMAGNLVGKQECDPYKHGRMPYLLKTRDRKRNLAISSRGVADEMLTNQLGRKKLEDAMIAQTELRSNPPRLMTMDGGGDGLRPGASLAIASRFLTGAGGPRFMDVPDISGGSIRMLEWLKAEKDDFYCTGPDADPDARRARVVRVIGKWCAIFEDIITLMCLNIQQNVDELQLGSVAGVAVNWTVRSEDLQGELDVVVRCDEGSIDPDLAEKKMENFMKFAAQTDRNGTMPWDYINRKFLSWIDPDFARHALTPEDGQERVKKDERQRISEMVSNQPLQYDYPADAPDVRKRVFDEWRGVPGTEQAIQSNEILMKQVGREEEWFAFAKAQFQVNPQTGRTGVPPQMEMAGMG